MYIVPYALKIKSFPSPLQVTIDVNYCENDLTNLLPASLFLKQTPSNAVGLRYLSGSEVTIVASKNTKRYRLQSNSLPVIGVTLEWLLERLHRYYSAEKPPFVASFTPPLPLPEYFEVIDRHYKVCVHVSLSLSLSLSLSVCTIA